MCNCRLKYPRGLSIVTCILLYIALIGLAVSYFQPYWLVIPKESEFGCVDSDADIVKKLETTDKGACGFSGMCYPMNHVDKLDNMTCYPEMGKEQCIWYTDLEIIGNVYDQACSLLFLAGLAVIVLAWFLTMVGCCSLTCCCCNVYTAVASLLTIGAVAILVAVLLWLGMFGEYNLTDQSCVNVFCDAVGTFDFGNCSIGWSGYLGIIMWFALVGCTGISWYNAWGNTKDINAMKDDERADPNATNRKAGKIRVTAQPSNATTRSNRSDVDRYVLDRAGHGATNGFAANNRPGNRTEMAWE